MTKLYILLIALFFTTSAVAQTPFSSVNFPVNNISYLTAETNRSGDVCIVAFGHTGTDFLIIDEQGKKVSAGNYPYNFSNGSTVLGMIGLPDKFIYFDKTPNAATAVQPYRVEKSNGAVTAVATLSPTIDEGSKLVQAYTSDNKLYILYYSNKTQRLQVCQFKNEQEFIVQSFHLPVAKLYDRLLKGEKPAYIDRNNEQTLAASSPQKKIYHEGESIYIVFDAFGAQKMNISNLTTEVLHLNLATEQADFKALPIVSKIRPIGMNSYLYQGNIFRVLIKPDASLQLSAYELKTLALKKEFVFGSKEPLTIKSSPVSVSKRRTGSADTTTIETTEKTLRKLGSGTAAIFAENVSPNVVQLTLGNYEAASNGSIYVPNSSIISQAGPAAIPVILAISALKVQATKSDASENSFKVYLENDNFEPTARIEKQSFYKQISDFENELANQKIPIAASFAYNYRIQIHYGYLNKNTGTIHIVSFSK